LDGYAIRVCKATGGASSQGRRIHSEVVMFETGPIDR
jgi:hypothetical protein